MRSLKSNIRPILVVLVPTVGVFINNKIGWILVTSFIYFIISKIGFSVIDSTFIEKSEAFIPLIIILILSILLIIINKEKVRNGTYGISKANMIFMNIISSIIGMGTTILTVYLNQ